MTDVYFDDDTGRIRVQTEEPGGDDLTIFEAWVLSERLEGVLSYAIHATYGGGGNE